MRHDLSELLEAIDIENYLDREGIQYRSTRGSSGEQFNLKECPVCGGSEWKVYIGAESGLGNCFHGDCEKKFNKFSFIKANMQGGSTSELMRYIKVIASEQGWRQKKKVKLDVDNDTNDLIFPESVELPFQGKNIKYLTNRGINDEIDSYFYLRYSKRGVFEYHDGSSDRKQNYADRVIIPIYDLEGTLISFQGRDITGESDRRYLFPPGFSSTGRYLFNGHNAIGSARVVICEGVFDVMGAKIALDCDVSLRDVTPIGSFGKHLSNGCGDDQIGELIKLKHRGLREVAYMWDGEIGAIKAAIKSAIVVSGLGIKTKVAILPKGLDPSDAKPSEVIAAYNSAVVINKISAIKLLASLSQY